MNENVQNKTKMIRINDQIPEHNEIERIQRFSEQENQVYECIKNNDLVQIQHLHSTQPLLFHPYDARFY